MRVRRTIQIEKKKIVKTEIYLSAQTEGSQGRDQGQSGSKPCRGSKARGEMPSHVGQSPSVETARRRQPGGPLAYEKGDQRPLNTK